MKMNLKERYDIVMSEAKSKSKKFGMLANFYEVRKLSDNSIVDYGFNFSKESYSNRVGVDCVSFYFETIEMV